MGLVVGGEGGAEVEARDGEEAAGDIAAVGDGADAPVLGEEGCVCVGVERGDGGCGSESGHFRNGVNVGR